MMSDEARARLREYQAKKRANKRLLKDCEAEEFLIAYDWALQQPGAKRFTEQQPRGYWYDDMAYLKYATPEQVAALQTVLPYALRLTRTPRGSRPVCCFPASMLNLVLQFLVSEPWKYISKNPTFSWETQ